MAKNNYSPVPHDHEAFLERALERKGFREAYTELENEYRLIRELLAARLEAGLTQEEVAACMGTTKSAVSRLEAAGKHSPSVAPLTRYAKAVGCEVEIKLVPKTRKKGRSPARQPLCAD